MTNNTKKILLFDLEKKENHTPNGLFSMAGGEDYDFYGNVIKRHPKNIRYVLDSDYHYDVIMGVDRALFHNFYGIKASLKLKVAWLLTPKDIYDNIYKYAVGMIPHIDVFITSDKEFVEEHEKAVYVPSINNWDNNKSFDGFNTPEDWIYENVLKEHIG